MGFSVRYLRLTFILLGLSVLLGIYGGLYKYFNHKMLLYKMISFVFGTFVNGLPEELFCRGFLLPRLEIILKNSLNALVISDIIFTALHIPSIVIKGNYSLLYVFLNVVSFTHPTGLIWGYLYLRTRSIIPGMIWHTSVGKLGTIFLGDFSL
ncbi:hypothetical protein AN618_11140 [Fervidicola ferrireducens]|uniref:CAAX prenyl protease 2/Lysostaphin resistance protein A-like domain-containing protein n=2 Tax=Fervidicola ferrireducens TaxID=520764 RepID=A0A140LA11_9FIRM|nr:hypothetical protein AN618_11140 [Fervidicola ferrireducens]